MAETSQKFPIASRLKAVQLRLAMVALMVMMLVTVCDVALRYVFGAPIRGAYDLVETCLAVFIFNGLAASFLARKNIVIDLVDSFAGRRIVSLLIRLSDVLTVALLGLMLWAMIAPALQAFDYGDRKLELQLPLWILWAVAIAGLAGVLICSIGVLFAPLRSRKGGEHP